jgi:ADP-ribosyl-[dinitrogen reductase] hydrolase
MVDPADIAAQFLAWYESGPSDIGGMARRSLSWLKHGNEWDEAGQHVWTRAQKGRTSGTGV